jgi:cleavage and polyadenylation specificity factor subunit 3
VLIVESTYGTHIHEKREDRENRFTSTVSDIVLRGGRCLIPVFALGKTFHDPGSRYGTFSVFFQG